MIIEPKISDEVVREEAALDVADLAVLDVPRQQSGDSLRETLVGSATTPADIELLHLRVLRMLLREPNRNLIGRHKRSPQMVAPFVLSTLSENPPQIVQVEFVTHPSL